jgi:RNA polymerase sigma-70 factor (ECF subfamily)
LLDDQDRALWDRGEIADGLALLDGLSHLGRMGPYALQASIAAIHAQSAVSQDADWRRIAALYLELETIAPSPVVALNHAVAVAMAEGPERGLALLDTKGVAGALAEYRWMHSARADLLRRLSRNREATEEYERAIALTDNAAERRDLGRRLTETSES